jgi:DNA-binding SARP family transcriptional activator
VPRLRLTTFGALALVTDGAPLGAAAGQRRPLAVLAMLVASGDAGVSRDKIIATLWPDAEPERGRRTLTQTLYSLRRATGVDDLVLGVADVRLNAAVVTSDHAIFDAALRAGRPDAAVEQYRGPFLDGFHVPGSDEFARWADAERARLARRCGEALRELARRAERSGDLAEAAGWHQRLVALDPVDSAAALLLVDTLARAGDRAGAVRAAHAHATRVRDELGLPVAPAIRARLAALAAEVRAEVGHGEAEQPFPTAARHRAEVPAELEAVHAPPVNAAPTAVPDLQVRRRATLARRAGRWAGVLPLVLMVLASGVLIGRWTARTAAAAPAAGLAIADPAAGVARESPNTEAMRRAYDRAEAAYRADRFQEAARLYDRALDLDSTFAPAALGLSLAADRLNSAEQQDRGLALAWASRHRLNERDRAYLVALAGPRYPAASPAREHLAAWERVVELAPGRAAAWTELGERFLTDGAMLGIRNADARAAAALRRALALDPDDATAARHRVELAVRTGDRAALAAAARAGQLARVGGELAGYLEWRVATARGDTATLARVRARFPSLGESSLRAVAMTAQHDGVGLADGARALRLLEAGADLAREQADVLLAQHALALLQGRPVLAGDVIERLEDVHPGSHAPLRLRVLDALYADGDTAAAGAAAGALARTVVVPGGAGAAAGGAARLADACVLAQWRAAPWRAGAPGVDRRAAARRAAALLREPGIPAEPVLVGAAPRACADLVEAMAAVASRAPDARARVEAIDALMLTGPALNDASAWATLAIARLYDQLGDGARALAVVRRRSSSKGWPRYLAGALAEEGRLALAQADTAGAVAAYTRLLAYRAAPEPPLVPHAQATRALVERLARRP